MSIRSCVNILTKLAQACSSFSQIVRSSKNVVRARSRIFFISVLRLNVYLRTRSLAFECLPAVEEFAALRVPASDPGVGGPGCG